MAGGIFQHFIEFCLKDDRSCRPPDRRCNVVGKILDCEKFEVIGNVCKRKSDSWDNGIRNMIRTVVITVIVIALLKD